LIQTTPSTNKPTPLPCSNTPPPLNTSAPPKRTFHHPRKAWKAEREKLLSERYTLAEQYYDLKADVRNIEVIQRGAESLMSGVEPIVELTQWKNKAWSGKLSRKRTRNLKPTQRLITIPIMADISITVKAVVKHPGPKQPHPGLLLLPDGGPPSSSSSSRTIPIAVSSGSIFPSPFKSKNGILPLLIKYTHCFVYYRSVDSQS